ncbi:hypothetical protein GCM10007385_15720 [Tateyamaria omphalii]|nr:hypothetical protein GCM10007385_15720 [Tateyamaria omphalii]
MNLAFSMAKQKNLRTVLLDLNLGHPSLAKRLGVPETVDDFSAFGGTMDIPRKVVRLGENLALGYTTHAINDASERLQNVSNGGIIDQVRQVLQPDVIIADTSPILRSDELIALAPQLGGVLLVADGQRTKANEITAVETLLKDRTRLIGVVLNRGKGA